MIDRNDEGPNLFARAADSQLRHLLLDERVQVVNVHGAPGAGKTTLVRAFVARHASEFDGGVRWLGRGEDLLATAQALPEARRSLLIVDDAETIDVQALSAVRGLLESVKRRATLLTVSRIHIGIGHHSRDVELPPLSLPRAVELLASGLDGPGNARLVELARHLDGNAAAVDEISRRLAAGVPVERILEWVERRSPVFAYGPDGSPLRPGTEPRAILDATVTEISESLIRELAARPEELRNLPPRRFEELVAELYRRRGFETTLTPASGDEGVDVYVVRHDELGRTLTVVQAKRYAEHHKVGAGVVRELLGTVTAKNASAGVLITTSFFEPAASKLEREFEFRLALHDYFKLQEMLRW